MDRSEAEKMTVGQMLDKLDMLFDEEEKIVATASKLKIRYEQLQEDKEMLQTMIMYVSNKQARRGM